MSAEKTSFRGSLLVQRRRLRGPGFEYAHYQAAIRALHKAKVHGGAGGPIADDFEIKTAAFGASGESHARAILYN